MAVYLIHLHTPLGNQRHTARHYIGYTQSGNTLENRIDQHRRSTWEPLDEPETFCTKTGISKTRAGSKSGNGSTMLAAANHHGITWEVVRVWKGAKADRHFERLLKRQRHHARFCPLCNPDWKKHYPKAIKQ